MEPQPKHVL